METKELAELLLKLRAQDETKWLEIIMSELDFFRSSIPNKYKDFIYQEYNCLALKINETSQK